MKGGRRSGNPERITRESVVLKQNSHIRTITDFTTCHGFSFCFYFFYCLLLGLLSFEFPEVIKQRKKEKGMMRSSQCNLGPKTKESGDEEDHGNVESL